MARPRLADGSWSASSAARTQKASARDWRALLTDGEFEPEEVAIYCPDCARKEFDD